MNLKQALDEFAKALKDKACQSATPLQESIDAFKALTAYYATQQKNRKNQADEESDPGEFSFADEVVNGRSPKAPARRNS